MSEILNNLNYEIYLFGKGNSNSLLRKVALALKNKSTSFNYNEIIRKIDPQIMNINSNNAVSLIKSEVILNNIPISEDFKQSNIYL